MFKSFKTSYGLNMRRYGLVICWLVALVDSQLQAKLNESDLGFPEQGNLDIERQNTRVPLYIPGKCPDNQLLYPGNQKNDWVCDCRPGYVYFAAKDGCFAIYRQGPCNYGDYLILPKGEFNPVCTNNKCNEDGRVFYAGACYHLNKPGLPCKPVEEGGGIFGVNTTTLELECLTGADRLSIIQVPKNCPPGTKRGANGCRKTYNK